MNEVTWNIKNDACEEVWHDITTGYKKAKIQREKDMGYAPCVNGNIIIPRHDYERHHDNGDHYDNDIEDLNKRLPRAATKKKSELKTQCGEEKEGGGSPPRKQLKKKISQLRKEFCNSSEVDSDDDIFGGGGEKYFSTNEEEDPIELEAQKKLLKKQGYQ